jgi:uracil phosphoribosyltransferase
MKELEHCYGPKVHIFESAPLNFWLAQLGHPASPPTDFPFWVRQLYSQIVLEVLEREFPKEEVSFETRMTALHPEQKVRAQVVQRSQRAVTVDLARAGIMPSQTCYEILGRVLDPQNVRQDHIFASRVTGSSEKVQTAELAAAKIGGDIKDAIVIFPDPMAATGHTICQALEYYKTRIPGPARKFLALHLILTPEYLARVTKAHPDVEIYGLRLDRGLSPKHVLEQTPGQNWSEERGLNDSDYILPGAGGVGEVLNNSFV